MTASARIFLLALLAPATQCAAAIVAVPAAPQQIVAPATLAPSTTPIAPADAVQLAAAAAPDQGVPGRFLLTVKATGREKRSKRIYLNSELDYRDQRNLTIEVLPPALPALATRFGKDLEKALIGKQLLVSGVAWRVKIIFGKPRVSDVTGQLRNKYYYQTHVAVVHADQIVLASPGLQ